MVLIATTLVLGLCQQPQVPVQPETKTQDVIILRAGERLAGHIVKETPDYIELRMGVGTIVGFDKSRILRITRSVLPAPGAATRSALAVRDQWFLLHNDRGQIVGHLHGAVMPSERGGFRISEEWHFEQANGSTDITLLEEVDDKLHPRSCFYHERSFRKSDARLLTERLVQGVVQGDRLMVQRRTLDGQEKTSYHLKPNLRFPMVMVEELRQQPNLAVHNVNQPVYDPRLEEFLHCKISARSRRRVEWKGRAIHVREITVETSRGSNATWLNAAAQTVRREVNGPSLVAVAASQMDVQRLRTTGKRGFPSALASNEKTGLALWLPNPTWRAVASKDGQVRIEAPLYGATAILMELDQIPVDAELQTATDAVLRWLRLSVGQKLRVLDRDPEAIRGRQSVRIDASYHVPRLGGSQHFRVRLHVLQIEGRFLALCCTMPHANYRSLQSDCRRICQSVELRRQDFAPIPQGPLKQRAKRR